MYFGEFAFIEISKFVQNSKYQISKLKNQILKVKTKKTNFKRQISKVIFHNSQPETRNPKPAKPAKPETL